MPAAVTVAVGCVIGGVMGACRLERKLALYRKQLEVAGQDAAAAAQRSIGEATEQARAERDELRASLGAALDKVR